MKLRRRDNLLARTESRNINRCLKGSRGEHNAFVD